MFKKRILLLLVVMLMFIMIPSSFAYTSGDADLGDGYIEFDEEDITIEEGDSYEITGVTVGSYMDAYEQLYYNLNYTDGQGQSQSYRVEYYYGDFYLEGESNTLNLNQLEGLTPSENPYQLTFSIVEDSYYEDFQYYYDCLIHDSWIYVTVQGEGTSPVPTPLGEIYVSTTGDDVNGDGSENNPYSTINRAIEVNQALGGGYEVIVAEGTYNITNMNIRSDITITGRGNVILNGRGSNNGFYIYSSSTSYVTLRNLTFTDVYRSSGGSAIMSSSSSTGDNTRLRIYNCTFENSTGNYGLIRFYGIVDIQNSTFMNNRLTSGVLGWSGIVNIQGTGSVNYCEFINNTVTSITSNANCGIYSTGNVNADYNYWGTNDRPSSRLASGNVNINNWVILTVSPSTIEDEVNRNEEITFNLDLSKYSDGTNIYNLPQSLREITLNPTAILGSFNLDSVVVGSTPVSVIYTADNLGTERVSFNLSGNEAYGIGFVVGEQYSGIVYVDANGDDGNEGSIDAPVQSIEKAVEIATSEGGSKEIVINEGTYIEDTLEINSDLSISANGSVIIKNNNDLSLFNILSGKVNLQGLTLNTTSLNGSILNRGSLTISKSTLSNENRVVVDNYGNLTVNYSNIYNIIENNEGNVSANYNWWGSNNQPTCVDVDYWVIMTVSTNHVYSNENSEITVSLNTVTDGVNNYTLDTPLPESEVTLSTETGSGLFNNQETSITTSLVNGTATVTFIGGNQSGSILITVDDETSNILVEKAVLFWFINDTGYRTLQQAVDAAGYQDTIIGIPGVYIVEERIDIGHRYFPAEPWEIIKSVSIISQDPQNPTIISGDYINSIIRIDSGSELTLENIILANAYSDSYAAAIFANTNTNLTIINSNIENNSARYAGAIESWGNLIIENSKFENNAAFGGTSGGYGGAIVHDGSSGHLEIRNAEFIGNNAQTFAGALYASSNEYTLIDNCTFIGNTANNGGALFTTGSNINIINSNFENNQAINNGFDSSVFGGAIYVSGNGISLYNTNFTNNTAEEYAGAIALGNNVYSLTDSNGTTVYYRWTTIDNCQFVDNSAGISAGAIYNGLVNGYSYTNVTNSLFVNNSAANAGALLNDNGFMWINGTEFIDNSADNGGAVVNTAIGYPFHEYINPGMIFDNTLFQNNEAINGGSVYNDGMYAEMTINNSNFINETGEIGGAIYNSGVLELHRNNFVNSSDSTYTVPIYSSFRLTLSNNTNNLGSIVRNDNVILDNLIITETITPNITTANNSVIISGTVTDDLGNPIDGQEIEITLIDGSYDVVEVINGTYRYEYSISENTPTGVYTIPVIYNGSLYSAAGTNATLTINLNTNVEISLNTTTASIGDIVLISGTVTSNETVNGNLTLNLPDGRNITVNVVNGIYSYHWEVPTTLQAGNYSITATFVGNEEFTSSSSVAPLSIILKDSFISITVNPNSSEVGEIIIISGNVTDDNNNPIDGVVEIVLPDNRVVNVNTENGRFSYEWEIPSYIDAGQYSIRGEFTNPYYNNAIASVNLAITAGSITNETTNTTTNETNTTTNETTDPTPIVPGTDYNETNQTEDPADPSIDINETEEIESAIEEIFSNDSKLEENPVKLTEDKMEKTANPIAMLLIALICILAIPLKRKL